MKLRPSLSSKYRRKVQLGIVAWSKLSSDKVKSLAIHIWVWQKDEGRAMNYPQDSMSSAGNIQRVSKNRRSFLGALLAVGSCCVGALLSIPLLRFALFPILRRTTELKRSPVGALTEFTALTSPVLRTIQIEQVDGWRKVVSEKVVYVTKDLAGQVRVLSSICPHLGCTVPWAQQKNAFVCPCHNAIFSPDGTRVSGPALGAWMSSERPPRMAS